MREECQYAYASEGVYLSYPLCKNNCCGGLGECPHTEDQTLSNRDRFKKTIAEMSTKLQALNGARDAETYEFLVSMSTLLRLIAKAKTHRTARTMVNKMRDVLDEEGFAECD